MIGSVCKTCVHYRQHYILDEQRCTPIACGHCVFPRLKHREPSTPACHRYQLSSVPPSLPDRDRVISFLATELLQYILNLDLPPGEQTQIAENQK